MGHLNPRDLRTAFGTFMTGVTVVTAVSTDGAPVGFTANSYSSVSLDPPLLLVCPSNRLSSFPVFNTCEHFAINILAEDQQDISNIFAAAKGDRFGGIDWQADAWGCPVIAGAATAFSCSAHHRAPAGDHLILVGQIHHFEMSGAAGLGFCNGGYFSLGMERRAQEPYEPTQRCIVGAIIEHDGKVLLEQTPRGYRPPQSTNFGKGGSLAAITDYLGAAGLDVQFGPVYSIFENSATSEIFTYYRATAQERTEQDHWACKDIGSLSSLAFTSDALTTMMRRYALEWHSGVFGLYVGNEHEGDVHLLGEGSKS